MAEKPRFELTYIRDWRKAKGLSLAQLADETNMDKGNLSKVERGFLPYNQEMLQKISKILQVRPAELLDRNPQDPPTLYSSYRRASASVKKQIERVVSSLAEGEG